MSADLIESNFAKPEFSEEELARQRALERYSILDTPADPSFDRIADLAARLLDMPISFVSLVDATRQWFKAKKGLEASESPRSISFCTHAIEAGDVMLVPDASRDKRFAGNPLVTGEPHVRFYAGAPLTTSDGYRIGTLCVIDRKPRRLKPAQEAILSDLAALVVDAIELHRANAVLAKMALTDTMTGVWNRRHFFGLAGHEVARVRRHSHPTTVMMIDLDHFKTVNDTYGHDVGDQAIVATAATIGATLRGEDVLARLGGEEFALLLPETAAEAAVDLANRLRVRISEIRLQTPDGDVSFTASIGVSAVSLDDPDIDVALKRADTALYRAKQAGRNRVELEE